MIRNKLLMAAAAAALLAGTNGAFAQEPSHGEKAAPKAQAPAAGGAMRNGAAEQNRKNVAEEPGQRGNMSGAPRRETTGQAPQVPRHETTGQAPQNERGEHATEEKSRERTAEPKAGEPKKAEPNRAVEKKQGSERNSRDNARGAREEHAPSGNERSQTTGQGAAGGRGTASVNITPENRTRIHDIIIKDRSAPRVEHVDFDLSVGTAIPRSFRIVAVPTEIVTIEPAWSGFDYFLVGDEIVIVDPRSMEIVAVLDA
jgi:hypothetical protein